MSNKSRFAFTHGQKAILWIGSFVCLWQFLQVPAVVNGLLDFYAAGVVPGTDIVLAPDTVLRLLFALVFFVAALLFYRRFKRRATQTKMSYKRSYAEFNRIFSLLYSRYVHYPADPASPESRWHSRIMPIVDRLSGWPVGRALVVAGVATGKMLARAGYIIKKAAVWFGMAMVYAGMAIGALTRFIWRQVEPSIRHFDRWLERKVNQNELGIVVVGMARTILRFSNSLWQKVVAVPDERTK